MTRARTAVALCVVATLGVTTSIARAQDSTAADARNHVPIDVELPLGVGFRLPSYDRVNGASIPWGPTLDVGEGRLVVDPTVAYRSNLGKFDPALAIAAALTSDSSVTLTLAGARGTFTNEAWIRSDLINSLITLGLGHDARNYFRGDRAEARLVGRIPVPGADDLDEDDDANSVRLFVGARTERDWSTGWRPPGPGPVYSVTPAPDVTPRGPWSLFNRTDERNGMTRPNPVIDPGHITSALLGGRVDYRTEPVTLLVDVLGEAGTTTLPGNSLKPTWKQVTLDGHTGVATFAGERIEVDGHLVTTTGGITPRQRYAYLGGSGTLATVDLLSLGGDHLYFVDARYVIPLTGIDLPFVGSPFIAPRFAGGAASVGGFGVPVENIGFRVGLGPLRFDAVWNPSTHGHDFGFGFAFSR